MSGVTITEFLLARIAEDEAVARACAEAFPSPWDVSDRGHSATVVADAPNFWPVAIIGQEQASPGRWPGEHLEHIARHDPARVLAECEAKRRIVELHPRMDYDKPYRGTPCCERCTADGEYPADDGGTDEQNWPCPTLRALALPYADHSDYDEAWRP